MPRLAALIFNFRRAKLVGADLRGANAVCDILDRATSFRGADLTDARLGGADLRTAIYDL